jgi:hypothetical protein
MRSCHNGSAKMAGYLPKWQPAFPAPSVRFKPFPGP